MKLSTSSGHTISIPLSLDSTRDGHSFREFAHRPYIFSGPVTGISRTDSVQVLKFEFWDEKQGDYLPCTTSECRLRCCGLCDITLWPWSTLPISRQGPLGEVIKWRDLYKIDIWQSDWDDAFLKQKIVEQHIGAPWSDDPQAQAGGPTMTTVNVGGQQGGFVSVFMGTHVAMDELGYIAVPGVARNTFAPNRIRVALSYSAICGFLVLQRRRDQYRRGPKAFDPVFAAVQDPAMRALAMQAKVGCGCRLIDWEHEDLGINVIRLEEGECNRFDRFR
jgi:hypothetical protein